MFAHVSTNMNILIWALVAGIVAIRAYWISNEIHYFPERKNFQLFKTNLIEAVILLAQALVVYIFPLPKTPFDSLFVVLGVGMYVLGIGLALWAYATMKNSWGPPAQHKIKQQDKLVTAGPYRVSRNPIYVAFFLIYFGFCLAIKSWLVILRFPLFIYFYRSAVREEQLLEKHFGKEYTDFKKRVPRFLII